jgi:hypothetical protein
VAQLQGASLVEAQLHGASLVEAAVNAADLSEALLWRTNWGEIHQASLGEIQLKINKDRTWRPVWKNEEKDLSFIVPWNAEAYAELRDSMSKVPEGKMRDEAVKRIETLDCSKSGESLASCDPAAKPPPKVSVWQKKLAKASVADAAYAKALAKELLGLVCANDVNAIYILRGIMQSMMMIAVGRQAPALVGIIWARTRTSPARFPPR